MRKRERQLAQQTEEALGLARESVAEASGHIALAKEVQQETMSLAHEAVAMARESVAVSAMLADRLKNAPLGEVLSADELQAFAEAVPQWTVSSGIRNGRAYKEYRRTLIADEITRERQPGGPLEHETYLSLADSEHSDIELANIFDTYYIDGDYINGKSYVIRFHADEAAPITYGDFARVLDAEAYLVEAGYIQEPKAVSAESN